MKPIGIINDKMEGEYGTFMIYLIFVILNMFAVWASRETSWSKLGLSAEF